MTWHNEQEPNLQSLPPFHSLCKLNNGRLHLFVFTLLPEFDTAKIQLQDLRLELQRQADNYLRKNYPDLAGNDEEINEILTAALNAQRNSELQNKNNLELSSVDKNNIASTSKLNENTLVADSSDSGLGISSGTVNFDIRFEELQNRKNQWRLMGILSDGSELA